MSLTEDEGTYHLVEETVEIHNKVTLPYAMEQLSSMANEVKIYM